MKFRTEESNIKYKLYKNKLTMIMRKAEKSYYCSQLDIYKNDIKKTWNVLNEISRRKSGRKSCLHSEFLSHGTIITDKRKISKYWSRFGPKKIKNCENKDLKHYMNRGK